MTGLRVSPASTAATARSLRPCSSLNLLPARPLQLLGVRPVPARHITHASSSRDDSGPAATAYLEAAVPSDQRPVNELRELKDDTLYSWGKLELTDYLLRLGGVFAFFTAAVGGPIAFQTFSPMAQPIEWILSATVGSLVVVALVVVRIFLGWSYVSERLLSAAYPYEETGWYDGQMFVKPPEVLTRDRLLGMYETKPVLQKLKRTMIGSGVALLASSVLLYGLISSESDDNGMYGRGAAVGAPRQVTSAGIIFSKDVKDLSVLREDDELAAREAEAAGGGYRRLYGMVDDELAASEAEAAGEAAGGVPGYCWDRYLRAQAGGGLCEKFDAAGITMAK
ncbi:hypothetical protein FOA52_000305 [Chlamydomonas sp. UWO 241]|nr:hypothetical protein FOA52_000305 [Chlamydomonas sp. UWO 241]